MAFTINKNVFFIDSMQFMNSGLDILVKNLPNNDFKHLSQTIEISETKVVYPYEYTDSFDNFSEDKLKNECISKKGCLHANNVRNMFKMNTLGDYHDLYLKTDVLLLADVFEKYISACLDYYGLDAYHYFSSPGLSWDVMVKMSGIKLELISDIDMCLFIEKE